MELGFKGREVTTLTLAVVSLVLLVASAAGGVNAYLSGLRADAAVLRAGTLRTRHLAATLLLLQDAESSQRGYLLTGRHEYLEPYERAVEQVDASLLALRTDYAGYTVGRAVVAKLETRVRAKFAEMRATLDVRDREGLEEARRIVLGDAGKVAMDAIRSDLQSLLDGEGPAVDRALERTGALGEGVLYYVSFSGLLAAPMGFCLILALRDARRGRHERSRLANEAERDPLTGLLNRRAFTTRLETALVRTPDAIGVIYLDLDGFKCVNDTQGHAAGDRVLMEVSRRLSLAVRSGDAVGRLGGDEFAVLLAPCRDLATLEEGRARLADAVRHLDLPSVAERAVSASLGAAVSGHGRRCAASLLAAADAAMYEAKAARRQSRRESHLLAVPPNPQATRSAFVA